MNPLQYGTLPPSCTHARIHTVFIPCTVSTCLPTVQYLFTYHLPSCLPAYIPFSTLSLYLHAHLISILSPYPIPLCSTSLNCIQPPTLQGVFFPPYLEQPSDPLHFDVVQVVRKQLDRIPSSFEPSQPHPLPYQATSQHPLSRR